MLASSQEKPTPASSWPQKAKKERHLIRVDTQGGRGAYDCNYNFTHVSSYTQNTKERIHSPFLEDPKNGLERREKCETTQVRSPYLTAFGTIAGLYRDTCQFSFENKRWGKVSSRVPDGRWKMLFIIPHHLFATRSSPLSSIVPDDRVHCL